MAYLLHAALTKYRQQRPPFPFHLIYKSKFTINVCFERHSSIKEVRGKLIARLSESVNVTEQDNEKQCDVKVVFCPIVSRAGTDIEAALLRVSDDKTNIMFVLHHTFDPHYNAPSSSRYERGNLMMVDILFHEDLGLLDCLKNNEAISKVKNYIKEYTKIQYVVCPKRVLLVIVVCVGIVGILGNRPFGNIFGIVRAAVRRAWIWMGISKERNELYFPNDRQPHIKGQ